MEQLEVHPGHREGVHGGVEVAPSIGRSPKRLARVVSGPGIKHRLGWYGLSHCRSNLESETLGVREVDRESNVFCEET